MSTAKNLSQELKEQLIERLRNQQVLIQEAVKDYDSPLDPPHTGGVSSSNIGDVRSSIDRIPFSFKWLFFTYCSEMSINLPNAEDIYTSLCILTHPVGNIYEEVNEDEMFLEIASEFYRHLLFVDELYVGYKIDGDEGLSMGQLASDKGGYKLIEMNSKKPRTTTVSKEQLQKNFQLARWDGIQGSGSVRLKAGIEIAYFYMRSKRRIFGLDNLTVKKSYVTLESATADAEQVFYNQFFTDTPFMIDKTGVDGNDVTHSVDSLCSAEELHNYQKTLFAILDMMQLQMGKQANLSPNHERRTDRDNYMGYQTYGALIKNTLRELTWFAKKVKTKGGLDLMFEPIGGMEWMFNQGEQSEQNEKNIKT